MLYCRRVKPIGTNGQRLLLVLQCWNKKLVLPWFSFSHLRSLCCRQSETGIRPRTSGFIFSSEKFEKKVCTADAGSQLGAMGQTNAFYCTSHTSLVKLGTTTTPVCASTKKYKKRENMYYCRYFHFRYCRYFHFRYAGYKES